MDPYRIMHKDPMKFHHSTPAKVSKIGTQKNLGGIPLRLLSDWYVDFSEHNWFGMILSDYKTAYNNVKTITRCLA